MKQLMLGNAAAARGLFEAGCEFISSYPGTPSTEITEEAAKFKEIYCEWAPNEKVALESAFESEVTQSCPTLSDPMDCSLPGSSVHGILQARLLEWVAIASSFMELLASS